MSSVASTSVRSGSAVLDDADSATVLLRRHRADQLDAVHAVVESGRWHIHGYRSPHAWLTTTSGEAPGAVRVTLHLADRIQRMPVVRSHFRDGLLAESALRLFADVWRDDIADAFARDEVMLCDWAVRLGHRDFKTVLSTWAAHADPERAERTAQERFDSRSLHLSELLDGMGRLDGLLDPEGFKLVQEAIRALSRKADDDQRTAAQRRADALVSMAKQALASFQPSPGAKRSRPKVVATVSYDDLVQQSRGGTLDTNSGRITLTADAIRRLACDAGIHRLVANAAGAILDYGRQTRTVSDTQFDALALRDHGCRVLGCPVPPGGCDAHHSIHWADDGNTDLDDLVLLCWFHHHWLHEQHWRLEPLGAGHFILIDPDGNRHPVTPPIIGLTLPDTAPTPLPFDPPSR